MEEVKKITQLCNAINKLVLDLQDKNGHHEDEILKLQAQVEDNTMQILALKKHLNTYVKEAY